MRLLRRNSDGELSLTRDLRREDTIPPYATLSHTWGADAEEVKFEDLRCGTGKDKPGYRKIQLCAEQARRDGLQYFWVDTCCIDKANKVELSQAINSMFRWYRDATRCYVYLSDFYGSEFDGSNFRRSRWFTRCWTLQELLAPALVEFFSHQWQRLGDKTSLMQHIHEATGIPHSALEGAPLAMFGDNERLSWTEHREATREEDKAYSLLGIFGVYISPLYGEGIGRAFGRLHCEIEKLGRCIQDLYLTDPQDDKKRIEDTKGGLLKESYRWVLYNASFQQWRNDPQSQLLWVKGDPGKGKTMLLCGIIDELQKSKAKANVLSFYFCQATDSRINSATAVLRGLLYLLIKQQPSLASHVRKKHDDAGKALFRDANAWFALSEIFVDILHDPDMSSTYLVIDALDECVSDLPKLLGFIAQNSAVSSRVKWIVSSRNWPYIEEQLERAGHKVRLSLELNAESVSVAVSLFVKSKVSQLAEGKKYDEQTRDTVLNYLASNANDTFLWVALVCQDLQQVPRRNVLKKLRTFPPGLISLYKRMMEQISASDDSHLCKQILALTAVLYRPVTMYELASLVEEVEDISDDLESVRELISLCGSFLTLREDTVYFVHQSAKDFLFAEAFNKVFPYGSAEAHRIVFLRSLNLLSNTLRRDIYDLRAFGYPAEEVEQPDPDPLATSRYSCVYWVNHLYDSRPNSSASYAATLQDGGIVDLFLREKYLYWLEALSLCRSMPKGVASMAQLWSLVEERRELSSFTELVHDANRFIMYHKGAIESNPLQAYASALLFSPLTSLVRRHFQHQEPKWITIKPDIEGSWSACLQTLEGHGDYHVYSVAFSHDSTRLASASADRTIKIWDTSSGACLQTLEGHGDYIQSVAFSHDLTRLASALHDGTVKIWDTSSGACLQTVEGYGDYIRLVAFSHDLTRLASASGDRTVKIWDTSSGACLQTLEGHSDSIISVTFSHYSTRLASASLDSTVKIWDTSGGACLQTPVGHGDYIWSVAFSHDSTRLASASGDRTVKIWDTSSGACLQTLEGHSEDITSVTFSHDSTWLASASADGTVKIWDAGSGACLQTLAIGEILYHLSFDSTGSYLHTEIGPIAIGKSEVWDVTNIMEPDCLHYQGVGVSLDRMWITYNGRNVLWVPSEYRAGRTSVCGEKVGVGAGSGRVWICSLHRDYFIDEDGGRR
ncbi:vegetative incompatibility protein HET-E-1 [Macrophomina phaseolina]|uniref:Vegetative incompatibility protein HET-E-1 n=1 Tax=Macrophomina phaseolina TaxID=35725 RepID=A0ABQ8FR30_9PEZI|nr:vegetative incompatibility protein HET-E-1 [Macrophomina phaseolina]